MTQVSAKEIVIATLDLCDPGDDPDKLAGVLEDLARGLRLLAARRRSEAMSRMTVHQIIEARQYEAKRLTP